MPNADMKRKVQSRFGDVARNYRKSAVHAAGPDLDLMVARSPLTSESVVLDAGCGAGHTAMAYAPHVQRVIACDFSGAMLEQVRALARERGIQNVRAQLADVDALPFPESAFDVVASRYSAHHWTHPQRALREFRRVLRDDGIFILSDIMAAEDYAQDSFLQCLELLRDPSHVRDYRISEWLALMAAGGFAAQVIQRFDLQLHFATWTRRMATPRANADVIKSLFSGASSDIQRAFQLPRKIDGDDFNFCIPGAVIRCQLAS